MCEDKLFMLMFIIMGIRSRSYPADVIASAILGYLAGHSQRDLSNFLGVPRTTIRDWIYGYRSGKVKADRADHLHHWVLESPNGPLSAGVCKVCFEEKEFPNSTVESSIWPKKEKVI